MKRWLVQHEGSWVLIHEAEPDGSAYFVVHPTPLRWPGVSFKEQRKGLHYKNKPVGREVEPVWIDGNRSWLEYHCSEWYTRLEAGHPILDRTWYIGGWYRQAIARFVGWPRAADSDACVRVLVSRDTTGVARLSATEQSDGEMPLARCRELVDATNTAWEALWPQLKDDGWDVCNTDRYDRFAVGDVAIGDLELIERGT